MKHFTANRLSILSLALSTAALTTALASGCQTRSQTSTEPSERPAALPSEEAASKVPSKGTGAAPQSPKKDAPARTARSESRSSGEPARAVTSAKGSGKNRAPGATAETAPAGLSIKRLVVTHAVDDREPAAVDSLEVGKPVYAFVELANDSSENGSVVITFERPGTSVGHVELDVPGESSRWRTWGKTALIRKAGSWSAVVRTKDGRELARQPFDVEGV